MGDKNNLDSYRRALAFDLLVSDSCSASRESRIRMRPKSISVPDPAGGPADPGDVRRHLGRRKEGFSLLWLVAPFACFLAPMFRFNASALIYGGGLRSARFRGPRPRVLVHCVVPSKRARPRLMTRIGSEIADRLWTVDRLVAHPHANNSILIRVTCPRVSPRIRPRGNPRFALRCRLHAR